MGQEDLPPLSLSQGGPPTVHKKPNKLQFENGIDVNG